MTKMLMINDMVMKYNFVFIFSPFVRLWNPLTKLKYFFLTPNFLKNDKSKESRITNFDKLSFLQSILQ